MISANLSNKERKAIYKRDGYRCALCDSTRYLQIHHHVPRGQGGTDSPHNLITLCSDCHALAHGTNLQGWQDVTQESIQQACTEYLADFYAPGWNPWAYNPYPCEQCPQRRSCRWPQLDEDCPFDAPPPRGSGLGAYRAFCARHQCFRFQRCPPKSPGFRPGCRVRPWPSELAGEVRPGQIPGPPFRRGAVRGRPSPCPGANYDH